ncbi:MAG: hypothetical protein ACRD0S_02510, partial [Acidimicrobiales bacterium]
VVAVLALVLTRDGGLTGVGTFDLAHTADGSVVTHTVEVPRSSLLLVVVGPSSDFDPDVAVSTDAATARELARYLRDAGYDRARFRGLFADYGYDPDGMSIVGRVDEGGSGEGERLLITAPRGGRFEVVVAAADGLNGSFQLEVTRAELSAADQGDEYIDDLVESEVAERFLSEAALADLAGSASIELGFESDEDDEFIEEEGDLVEHTVTVPATTGWTETDLHLELDDEVTITADGQVFDDLGNNPNQSFGPDGAPDPEGRHAGDPYRQFNHAALLARIGEEGEPFVVGSALDFTAEEEGTLYLGVNDGILDDNGGELRADIEVTTP